MTLWDFEKVMRHSLAIVLEELRIRIPNKASAELSIDRLVEIRNAVADELRGKRVRLEEVRLRAFMRTIELLGSRDDDLAAHLNSLYLKHRFEDINLYPDVICTLDVLCPRFTVGLLSNGNGYPDRSGLPQRFDFVVFSEDLGIEKPDARIFRKACSIAGCSPHELMHVGDSLDADVAGAIGVGATSVWLNRDNRPNDSGIAPDYEVRSLAALTSILVGESQ